jgi:hypothetical protein
MQIGFRLINAQPAEPTKGGKARVSRGSIGSTGATVSKVPGVTKEYSIADPAQAGAADKKPITTMAAITTCFLAPRRPTG